ncbi:hypothetical protein CIPAW_12G041800 [Carya illinoinensis]|uniref:Uncharacterized protein n=1 Tax=Carya illinoinensis TaxID=32201 RepID=A0A8T1NVX9_CARIL|nr:hypothetical protein CIPAW_12G041800 [Carya illinoinensis]
MILNSSKQRTPSPFKSNCLIITVHSSMDFESPNLLSILFRLLGVINPHPSVSYIEKASLKSFTFSSSPPPCTNPIKSSKDKNPSPSESNASTATFISFENRSPPMTPNRCLKSEADIFPSPSSSKYSKTLLNSSPFPISVLK